MRTTRTTCLTCRCDSAGNCWLGPWVAGGVRAGDGGLAMQWRVAPGARIEVSVRGSVVPRQTSNWRSHLRSGAALRLRAQDTLPKARILTQAPGHDAPLCVGLGSEGHWWNLSSRSCCSEDARAPRKRSSRTAAVSPEEMRTTSRWALNPKSASWISTSISKRRLKVGWAAAGGSAWRAALVSL